MYIANYHEPCAAFRDLREPDASFRILVLFGKEPNMGKTWLIQHFRESLPRDVDHVGIDIDPQFDNVRTLMHDAVRELGKQRFPQYLATEDLFKGPLKSIVRDNRQYGFVNNMTVNLSLYPEEQDRRLTNAWLDDLEALTRPLLISVDAYDRASSEEKAWFRASLFPAARRAPFLRIVVAGREAPEPHSSWAPVCGPVHELRGVPDAKHWMPIVAELNRDVRVVPPEQGVQNCCDMVAGKPDIILKWILSLRERGAAT